MPFAYLRNTFSKNIFVVFLCNTFAVIMRFEHSFDFFHDPLLSLDFLEKLENKKRENKFLNFFIFCFKIQFHTFSFTAISTAEVGTSSMIFNLSSTIFAFTILPCLPVLPKCTLSVISRKNTTKHLKLTAELGLRFQNTIRFAFLLRWRVQ